MTDDSVATGLAATNASIAELHGRLDRIERSVTAADLAVAAEVLREWPVWTHRHALALEAQTHRVEECIAFLEVQHDAVREVLDQLRPSPSTADGPPPEADPR